MSALLGVPVDAAYHLVFALTNVLTPVLGGLATVAAIVVFTVAVRLILVPLTFRALRGQGAQARLAPQVQRLRQRHAQQPDRFQRELTELYQREGTSLFAGFAPLLVQWPVFSVLYLLFRSPSVGAGRTCCCHAPCSACRSAATGFPGQERSVRTVPSSLAC